MVRRSELLGLSCAGTWNGCRTLGPVCRARSTWAGRGAFRTAAGGSLRASLFLNAEMVSAHLSPAPLPGRLRLESQCSLTWMKNRKRLRGI